MMSLINEAMLAVSSSLAASIAIKATIVTALALMGAWLARGSRAAVRHALLAAAFGVLLALPVASLVIPSIRIAVPDAAQQRTAPAFAAASAIPPVAPARASVGVAQAVPRSGGFSVSVEVYSRHEGRQTCGPTGGSRSEFPAVVVAGHARPPFSQSQRRR